MQCSTHCCLLLPHFTCINLTQLALHSGCLPTVLCCLICLLLVVVLQLSRFSFKNWMNAATDLYKSQFMLLNCSTPYVLRQQPRLSRWVQTFKRTTTMVLRRCVSPGKISKTSFHLSWMRAPD